MTNLWAPTMVEYGISAPVAGKCLSVSASRRASEKTARLDDWSRLSVLVLWIFGNLIIKRDKAKG